MAISVGEVQATLSLRDQWRPTLDQIQNATQQFSRSATSAIDQVADAQTQLGAKSVASGQQQSDALSRVTSHGYETTKAAQELHQALLDAFTHPMGALIQLGHAFESELIERIGRGGVLIGGLIGAAVGAGAAIYELSTRAAEAGAHMLEMSLKTGTSVESMGALSFVSQSLSGSVDGLSNSMFMLSQRVGTGSAEVTRALDNLGLSWTSFAQMAPDEQLLALSDAMRGLPPEVNKSTIAFQLFGRQGREMLPQLLQPMRELYGEGQKLNVWTKDSAEAAHKMEIAMNTLKAEVSRFALIIGQDLIVSMTQWIQVAAQSVFVTQTLPAIAHAVADGFKTVMAAATYLVDIVIALKQRWDDLPPVLRQAAEAAIIASAGIWTLNKAVDAVGLTWTGSLGTMANLAQIWSVLPTHLGGVTAAIKTLRIEVGLLNDAWAVFGVSGVIAYFRTFVAAAAASTTAVVGLGIGLGTLIVAWDRGITSVTGMKDAIGEWILSSDEMGAGLIRILTGQHQLTEEEAHAAVSAHNHADALNEERAKLTDAERAAKDHAEATAKLTLSQRELNTQSELMRDTHRQLTDTEKMLITVGVATGKSIEEITKAFKENLIAGDDATKAATAYYNAIKDGIATAQAATAKAFVNVSDTGFSAKLKQFAIDTEEALRKGTQAVKDNTLTQDQLNAQMATRQMERRAMVVEFERKADDDIRKMAEDTANVRDRLTMNSFDAERTALARKTDEERIAAERELHNTVALNDKMDALRASALANLGQINQKEILSEQDAIGKGIMAGNTVLLTMMQTTGVKVLSTGKEIASTGALIEDSYMEAGRMISVAMNQATRDNLPLTEAEHQLILRMKEVGVSAEDIGRFFHRSAQVIEADAFQLGDALKKNLLDNLQRIPDMMAQAFTSGGGLSGAMQGIGSMLGSTLGGNLAKDTVKHFGGDLTKGLGALAGPIGSALGSLVGPAIDALMNIGGPSKDELAARDTFANFEKQLGTSSLPDTLAKIADAYKKIGKSSDDAARDMQRALDATHISAAAESDALKVLNDNLDQAKNRAAQLQTTMGGFTQGLSAGTSALASINDLQAQKQALQIQLGDKQIADLAKIEDLNKKIAGSHGSAAGLSATDTQNLANYNAEVAKLQAMGSLTDAQQKTLANDLARIADLRTKEAALKGASAAADAAHAAAYQQQIDALTGGQDTLLGKLAAVDAQIQQQQAIYDITALKSQAAASAVSASIVGITNANMKAGMSFIDAVKAAQPAVSALDAQLKQTGFTGGAAFQFLQQEVALAADAIAGPALASIHGYTQGLQGLSDAGLLDQSTFIGLASQISGTEQALLKQGYSAKTVSIAMQGDLQTLWEMEQKYGFKADDVTQSLIDQGVQSGLIGEQGRSDQQKILDVLIAIGEALGATIPDSLKKFQDAGVTAADAVADAMDKIPTDIQSTVTINGGGSGFLPGDQFSHAPSSDGLVTLSAAAAKLSGATRLQPSDAAWWEWQAAHPPVDASAIPMALGGKVRVTHPTLFMVGENGPEDAAFSGSNKSFSGGGTQDLTDILDGLDAINTTLATLPDSIRIGMRDAVQRVI